MMRETSCAARFAPTPARYLSIVSSSLLTQPVSVNCMSPGPADPWAAVERVGYTREVSWRCSLVGVGDRTAHTKGRDKRHPLKLSTLSPSEFVVSWGSWGHQGASRGAGEEPRDRETETTQPRAGPMGAESVVPGHHLSTTHHSRRQQHHQQFQGTAAPTCTHVRPLAATPSNSCPPLALCGRLPKRRLAASGAGHH